MAEFPSLGRASGSPSDTETEQDDLVLVRAVSQYRDERAFRTLYRRHTPRLLSVARRVMGNELDAEDVVQETWVRAVHRMNDFRGESQLSTWLFGIGIHVAQTALRRQNRWIEDYDPELIASERSPSESIDLERALAQLPHGYRTVLLLHDLEGFTHVDIAAMLGVTPGTSKAQLFHARRAMRRLLSPSVEVSNDG